MTKEIKSLFGDSLYFKKNRRVAYVILINGPAQYLIRLSFPFLILPFNEVGSHPK